MKLQHFDVLDTEKRYLTPELKKVRGTIDKIAMLLFGHKAGFVRDPKRSPVPQYYGVNHEEAKIMTPDDKPVMFTFDNSTSSTEFEINSLVPFMIVKGSALDEKIKKLYKKHKITSKKMTNYIVVNNDKPVMREVHLGEHPPASALDFVKELLELLKKDKVKESVELGEALDVPQDLPRVMRVVKPLFLGRLASKATEWTTDGEVEHRREDNIKPGCVLVMGYTSEKTIRFTLTRVGEKQHEIEYVDMHPNEIEKLMDADALKKLT